LLAVWITRVNTDSPTSSLHRLLANPIFLSNYTVELQCLQRAPGRRVTEKSHFSTLNVGLAGTGNQTQATCLAGSVSRRSAIHYAFLQGVTCKAFSHAVQCVVEPVKKVFGSPRSTGETKSFFPQLLFCRRRFMPHSPLFLPPPLATASTESPLCLSAASFQKLCADAAATRKGDKTPRYSDSHVIHTERKFPTSELMLL
jgi:hypothetical protein